MKIMNGLRLCTLLLLHYNSFSQPTISLRFNEVTNLPAAEATLTGGLSIHRYQDLDKDPKVFAIENWSGKEQTCSWNVHIPRQGLYKAAALINLKTNVHSPVELRLSAGKTNITLQVNNKGWNKIFFPGSIKLDTDVQQLRLQITSMPGEQKIVLDIYSIEMATEEAWAEQTKEAEKLRSKPAWLNNAMYGLFFHWNARSQPETGKAKSYADAVNDFDVSAFAQLVKSTGADFIILTTSWDLQTFPAPLTTLDRLLPGNTTQRDLVADMAEALLQNDIQLIVYCNFRINRLGWKKEDRLVRGGNKVFFDRLISIYDEIGKRYANKIAGVWIDDGMGLYPYNAPFKAITSAIKQNDKNMIVCYNSWIYPRFTDFQDFYGGEHGITLHAAGVGNPYLPVGGDGYFISGPQQGLKATFCGLLEPGDWTHTEPNQVIPPPLLSSDSLANIVKEARLRKNLPVMNVQIYQDGTISPETLTLLKHVKESLVPAK
ncbi:MAG: hypothetical protein KF746_10450 [Chitinophagaceae bacterium]|nr:hypothetical protein [Chitinophagaceae bacterium]